MAACMSLNSLLASVIIHTYICKYVTYIFTHTYGIQQFVRGQFYYMQQKYKSILEIIFL